MSEITSGSSGGSGAASGSDPRQRLANASCDGVILGFAERESAPATTES